MQPGRRVDPVRVHRHDVGVLEPRQGLRLARAAPRDLERHRPIGQLALLGQEDPGERPAAQLLDQQEPGDRLAGFGKRARRAVAAPLVDDEQESVVGGRARADQLVDLQDAPKRLGNLGETGEILRRDRGSPGPPPAGRTLRRSGRRWCLRPGRDSGRDTTGPRPFRRLPSAGPCRRGAAPAVRRARRRPCRLGPGIPGGRAACRSGSESRQACSYFRARRTAAGDDASSHVRRLADRFITGSPTPSPCAVASLPEHAARFAR